MNFLRTCLVCLATTSSLLAHAADPGSILIRNATLIDRAGSAGDVVVSVLIKGGKLDLVTEERISRDEAELVIEAEKRILLGNLSLNEAPSFVILEEDPRKNFNVLRDSAAYVKFAIEMGSVVTNTMPASISTEPEPEK